MRYPIGTDELARKLEDERNRRVRETEGIVVIHHTRRKAWDQFNLWQRTRSWGVLMCMVEVDPRELDWRIVKGRTVLLLTWADESDELIGAILAAQPDWLTRIEIPVELALPEHYCWGGGEWQIMASPGLRERMDKETGSDPSTPSSRN